MAAFIKRILKSNHIERHSDWASHEEREQYKRQREQWKTDLGMLTIVR